MRRDPRAYIWDAVQALDSISAFVRDRSFTDYDADELLRSAVERKFEITGEALNQLSKIDGELAARVPGLRQIVGFRNILIHGYARVDNVQVPGAVLGDLARRPDLDLRAARQHPVPRRCRPDRRRPGVDVPGGAGPGHRIPRRG